MRKSEITRTPTAGKSRCMFKGRDEIRCTERAAEIVTVTSFPTAGEPFTGTYRLCTTHADVHVGAYEREWSAYPEMFDA